MLLCEALEKNIRPTFPAYALHFLLEVGGASLRQEVVEEDVGHYEERQTRKHIHQKSEDGRRLVVEAADVRVHELTGFENRVPDGAYVVPRTARVEEGGVEVEEPP